MVCNVDNSFTHPSTMSEEEIEIWESLGVDLWEIAKQIRESEQYTK